MLSFLLAWWILNAAGQRLNTERGGQNTRSCRLTEPGLVPAASAATTSNPRRGRGSRRKYNPVLSMENLTEKEPLTKPGRLRRINPGLKGQEWPGSGCVDSPGPQPKDGSLSSPAKYVS